MAATQPNANEIEKIKGPASLPVDTRSKRISAEEKKYYVTQTHGLEQDIAERATYSLRIFILCCVWVFGIFVLLLAQGFSWKTHFLLSEPVLLAAIGSTTANIIAVFVIVARYLFPNRSGSN